MLGKLFCSAALAACLAIPAGAESTTQPVVFAVGATGTAVSGQVTGRDTADFTLVAEAGQRMTVRMNTDNPSSYFNIYPPGSVPGESQAIFIGSTSGLSADLPLPTSGTYLIRTYLMASAGRENESARFSLTIDVAGRKPQSNDVANSLNAEPDYWQVTGITGQLNIRAEASTSAAIAGTVAQDATLRNLGCETAGERNWCRVETTSGTPITGWAASDFLTQGSAPASATTTATNPTTTASGQAPATIPLPDPIPPARQSTAPSTSAQPPAPAPAAPQGTTAPTDKPAVVSTRPPAAPPTKIPLGGVARPAVPEGSAASSAKPPPKPAQANAAVQASADASGSLPCSTALGMPTRGCAYTVTRSSNGNATIRIAWPDGGHREIRFENGAPVPVNQQTTERRGDLTVINLGNERYEVPDAIVNGG